MTPRLRLSDPLLRVQSDERLAALAGHGGDRAFAILVERHRGGLLAFARRLGAGAGAEDVVQQALLHAWSALGRGTQVVHVSAWLHQITRNAAIRAAARTLDSAELPSTLVAASQTADEVELRHETRRLLDEIERLPARQREALVRLAVAGGSGDEVGRAMDLEANAVRQLAHRARTRLRMAMGACVPWPLALWAARGGVPLAVAAPELLGGAGLAGGAGASAGLLKLGVIATATVGVAVGAGGIVRHDSHRAAATRSHVAVARERAGSPAAVVAPTLRPASSGSGGSEADRSGRRGPDSSGEGSRSGSDGGSSSASGGGDGGTTHRERRDGGSAERSRDDGSRTGSTGGTDGGGGRSTSTRSDGGTSRTGGDGGASAGGGDGGVVAGSGDGSGSGGSGSSGDGSDGSVSSGPGSGSTTIPSSSGGDG